MKMPECRVAFSSKPRNLADVRADTAHARPTDYKHVAIAEIVTLTAPQYDAFAANFYQTLPWLTGKGGRAGSLLVRAPGRTPLVVNPEGYDYARYVAVRAISL